MTFRLTIDEPRWHAAIRRAAAQSPGLVPVIKGNGYGFGRERLAELCGRLGVDTVAVGTEAEIPSVRLGFHGTIAVMAPLGTADLNPEPRRRRCCARWPTLRWCVTWPAWGRPDRRRSSSWTPRCIGTV